MRANRRIDRNSPIPYYHQLKQLIIADIAESDRRPGDRLPGDEALCATFGVSRTVVRQALGELETAGVVVREKGRGTFVASTAADEGLISSLNLWYDDLAAGPVTVPDDLLGGTLVRRLVVAPADEQQAADLQIEAGAPVVHLERIRYAADEPAIYTVAEVPHDLAPGLEREELTERPLAQVLDTDFGIRPARSRRDIRAVAAGSCLAGLLGIRVNDPLLVVRAISYDETDRPILRLVAFHRGDRSRLRVELRAVAEM